MNVNRVNSIRTELDKVKSHIALASYESYVQGVRDVREAIDKMDMMKRDELEEVFGCDELKSYSASDVLDKYGIEVCLKKIRDWEKVKEAEKVLIGDVVEVYRKTSDELYAWGIYMGTKFGVIHIFSYNDDIGADNFSLSVKSFYVKKTGGHVDILGMFK